MLKVNQTELNNYLEKLDIDDNRFDNVYISFSFDAPYYALENNVQFTPDSNGKVLIDSGYRNGNKDNRFAAFIVKNGEVDRNSQKTITLYKNDKIRDASNIVLSKYTTALEYSGFNETQVKLLLAGVSI